MVNGESKTIYYIFYVKSISNFVKSFAAAVLVCNFILFYVKSIPALLLRYPADTEFNGKLQNSFLREINSDFPCDRFWFLNYVKTFAVHSCIFNISGVTSNSVSVGLKNTQTSWVWKRSKDENILWLIAFLEYK